MTSENEARAKYVASLLAGGIVGLVLDRIEYPLSTVVSGGVIITVILMALGGSLRRGKLIWLLVAALGALGISFYHYGVWPDKGTPSLDDISIVFVPDYIDTVRLTGRVVVRSTAKKPLTITEIRLASAQSTTGGRVVANVKAGAPASFPFEQYFWRGGSVDFEAHYSVNGTPAKNALSGHFAVPAYPNLTREIEPLSCCQARKSDFAALRVADAEEAANNPEGCFPIEPSERRLNGQWDRVRDEHKRRIFVFDPVDKLARMQSLMRGRWYGLSVPFLRNSNGSHVLRYCWHEKNGYMSIEADDNYATFDVDTGKVLRGKLHLLPSSAK
ncbi:hypothetical protein ACYZX9_18495 [Sphingomonas citri]